MTIVLQLRPLTMVPLLLLLSLTLLSTYKVTPVWASSSPTNIISNPSFENGLDPGTGFPSSWDFATCEGVGDATVTLDSSTKSDGGYSARVYSGNITQNTWCLPTNGTRTVGFTQFRQFIMDPVNFTDLTDGPGGFSFWFKLQPYNNTSGMAGFDIRVFGAESIAEMDYAFEPDPSLNFVNQTGVHSFLFYGYQPGQWYHFSRNLRADWRNAGLPLKYPFSLVMFEGLVLLEPGNIVKSETFWLDDVRIYAGGASPSVTISSVTPNPANTGEPVTVRFAATNTSTLGGITINWGDGTTSHPSITATSDTHTYLNTGGLLSKQFTINVTNNNGAGQASASIDEVINDRPPAITITGVSLSPASTGQSVRLNLTVSDPDGNVSTVYVDWGDGSRPDLITTMPSVEFHTSHTYTSTGNSLTQTFTIHVNATDNSGFVSFLTTTYTALDRSPGVTITGVTPNPAVNGITVTATFSALDPDGTVSSIAINWGDGSPPNTLPGTATSATHIYSFPGSFTVTINATDNSGSRSQRATLTVNVTDLPPADEPPTIFGVPATLFYYGLGGVLAMIAILAALTILRKRRISGKKDTV